ncbi:hypothetical protein EU96_1315 [Prochlorococcus marinus str. MIT 9302]|uniref:Uncharacterized protein n=1 Tax=Prochlorococcus marinus str. MIT 9302 TaxID=74545 RepID=A0A0A2A9X4_PROMR|nr:hypothetical protein EU96_1315 [Prochlorococcus marinus str. MIT 9302]
MLRRCKTTSAMAKHDLIIPTAIAVLVSSAYWARIPFG